MDCLPLKMHPATLLAGETYWLYARDLPGSRLSIMPVRFVAYDPCPAVVIVQNGAGRVRVPRRDLREPLDMDL